MEKNKKILIGSLRKLPIYQPEDEVWESLSAHFESETLSNKLPQLSNFDPPDSVWKSIDEKLNMGEIISVLPEYNPTDSVWENISESLPFEKGIHSKSKLVNWVKWTSVAAAIFIIGYFILSISNEENKQFSYSEELIELTDTISWNENDQSVEYALTLLCEENPIACKTTEFKEMENELIFLDQSKQAILQQLNKYDSNTELEILLTEIELERSNLIKEMIEKTIL
ncbi:MAG TPA: hypothetical protein VIN10_06625 [Bacteroidales bacterium]